MKRPEVNLFLNVGFTYYPADSVLPCLLMVVWRCYDPLQPSAQRAFRFLVIIPLCRCPTTLQYFDIDPAELLSISTALVLPFLALFSTKPLLQYLCTFASPIPTATSHVVPPTHANIGQGHLLGLRALLMHPIHLYLLKPLSTLPIFFLFVHLISCLPQALNMMEYHMVDL